VLLLKNARSIGGHRLQTSESERRNRRCWRRLVDGHYRCMPQPVSLA